MEKDENREVLLFFCTQPDKVKRRILRFRDAFLSLGKGHDFAIVSFSANGTSRSGTYHCGETQIAHHVYGPENIPTLGYSSKGARVPFKLIPGNCDLVPLLFWKSHPQYDRVWLMEDDIEYTGDPQHLFADLACLEGDLLATHVAKCYESWTYTSIFRSGNGQVNNENRWLTFLPFFRINRRALELIDQAYVNGWDGHHEMTWPTILKAHQYDVVDIGGQGEYVPETYRNKHYIGVPGNGFDKTGSFGTMKIRLRPGKQKNVLWHPIKTPKAWARQNTKRLISIAKWQISKIKQRGARFRPGSFGH